MAYDNEEKIQYFLSDVKRARDFTLLFAERLGKDKTKQKLLYETARSQNWRFKILEAMLANDMDRVHELLRVVIEKAYEADKTDLPP